MYIIEKEKCSSLFVFAFSEEQKKVYKIDTRLICGAVILAQFYKTFYGRNMQYVQNKLERLSLARAFPA
jgi:hypothetical protein